MAPNKKITVTHLSFVTYQHPNLEKAAEFLRDFGFDEADKDDSRIYFAGVGKEPYSYVAEQSPDSKRHFLGGTWTVASEEDLEAAASHPQFSTAVENKGPGGGKIVTLLDPNGFPVSFIYGQKFRSVATETLSRESDKVSAVQNSALQKPRQGKFRRFAAGPSPIHKTGHYGYFVPANKYKETFDWYTSVMNLTPTDAIFDPSSKEDKVCFMHIDLGEEYTDHHSFFVGAGPEDKSAHVHHTSFEINDFDTQSLGHDWLRNKGWTNCWGIGRHVLGSQIFDYWFDASGNILEHYSDGDLVNKNTPVTREPEAPETLYVWGPNISLGFLTGKIEDAGKLPPLPPPVGASS